MSTQQENKVVSVELKNGVETVIHQAPTTNERYEDRNFVDTSKPVWNYSILYDDDIVNYQNGSHYSLYKKFGSKKMTVLGKEGYYFCLWAPNATKVSVVGNFNDWNKDSHQLQPRWDNSGIWEGFIPGIKRGELYKYNIRGFNGIETEKGDPLAHFWEKRPLTSSITWEFDYQWRDDDWIHPGAYMKSTWLAGCGRTNTTRKPITPMGKWLNC